jgi:UDP-glucose 4-epimerase
MNYKGKKVALTGADGFLGSAIGKALHDAGAEVFALDGDIRDRRTFDSLDFTFDYLFHFGAPSSQVQFKRMPSYCIQTTLTGFMNAATAAKRHGIRLVYPSTGLLSMGEANEYARCKALCEDYARGKNMDAIGLRIFATYGPGEGHKRDYASVPYLFARDVVAGNNPVVFGDGEQVRDFIYIDDVVNAVLILAEECADPVIDIGSGEQTSFNKICELLGNVNASTVQPLYKEAPNGYVKETAADPKRLHEFYRPVVSLERGIREIVKSLKEEN